MKLNNEDWAKQLYHSSESIACTVGEIMCHSNSNMIHEIIE